MTIKDRLSRAEGQVKIGEERSLQLESSLSHARNRTRSLERTVQQLHDQVGDDVLKLFIYTFHKNIQNLETRPSELLGVALVIDLHVVFLKIVTVWHQWTYSTNPLQNEQLQKDFDVELNKLKESMRKNTLQLEEIAAARESLQAESVP